MAFQRVNNAFLEVTLLHHPDPHLLHVIQTDASDIDIGACLYQVCQNKGEKLVIAYGRKF